MTSELSVSILSFNTCALLAQTLRAVVDASEGIHSEIFVIDNGSHDGSPDLVQAQFPNIRLIRNKTNCYYAANNQAFTETSSEFFLILSSDVIPEKDVFHKMIAYLRTHPKCAAVGPGMRFSDGKLQRNCSRHYTLRLAFYNFTLLGKIFRRAVQRLRDWTFYANWDRTTPRSVEVYPDSCLMLRRLALNQGELPYDPGFKLYFTENDLCKRLTERGWTIDYQPDMSVTHQEMQSVRTVEPAVISLIYRQDITAYFVKYEGRMMSLLLRLGIEFSRLVVQALHHSGLYRFKKNLVWGIS